MSYQQKIYINKTENMFYELLIDLNVGRMDTNTIPFIVM